MEAIVHAFAFGFRASSMTTVAMLMTDDSWFANASLVACVGLCLRGDMFLETLSYGCKTTPDWNAVLSDLLVCDSHRLVTGCKYSKRDVSLITTGNTMTQVNGNKNTRVTTLMTLTVCVWMKFILPVNNFKLCEKYAYGTLMLMIWTQLYTLLHKGYMGYLMYIKTDTKVIALTTLTLTLALT